MRNRLFRNRSSRRCGAAAVEMAIVAPPLLILLFGSIEVNRAIQVQQTLEEAARASCRVRCITLETTEAEARAIVDQTMAAANITGYTVTFDPAFDEDADEDGEADEITYLQELSVTVSVPYESVEFLSRGWIITDESYELAAVCTMPADNSDIFDEDWTPPPPPDPDPEPDPDPDPDTGGGGGGGGHHGGGGGHHGGGGGHHGGGGGHHGGWRHWGMWW